jgi:hypothetical protein
MIDHEVKKQIRPGIANVDIAKSTFDHYDKNKDGGVTLNIKQGLSSFAFCKC